MLPYLYIILLLIAIISIEIVITLDKMRERRHKRQLRLSESYIRQITKILFADECLEIYPQPNNTIRRTALAEAIYLTLSHTYGNDYTIIRELARRYRLDIFLQQRIRWSYGYQRAHTLMLLSAIPSNYSSTYLLRRYLRSHNNDIRTAALLAALATHPSKAIATIASISFKLSPLDIFRIIGLLRRGLFPIAYEPLLMSSNRNLKMLGMAIVRSFGIGIADKHLQYIISTESDYEIIHEAIYTISTLGRPLRHNKVRERISHMPQRRRKQLCRHLTKAGYSLSVIRCIFSAKETLYSEAIIKSFKRSLTCSQSSNIS